MKFQNPSLNSFLNGTSRKQYAPHFFKVGGIKTVLSNKSNQFICAVFSYKRRKFLSAILCDTRNHFPSAVLK